VDCSAFWSEGDTTMADEKLVNESSKEIRVERVEKVD